jgi:hypothetical protein
MLFKVHVEDSVYAIPVSSGEQSVRWLAATAVARHFEAQRGRGFVRARDAGADSSALPRVASVVGEWANDFVGPAITCAQLHERLFEAGGPDAVGFGVRVALEGAPARAGLPAPHGAGVRAPLWHSLAYHYSLDGRAHADAQLGAFAAEKAQRDAVEAERREKEVQEQMVTLGRLLVSDVEDPDAAESNFLYDFSNIRVKHVTEDAEEGKKIRRILRTNYLAITDLFRHFSGGSSKGATSSMQKQELTHMLVLCQGLDIIKERPTLEALFAKAREKREGEPSEADSLARYELMEFIVMFANARHGGEVDMRSGQVLGPANALAKYLRERLVVLHTKLNAGPVRAALKEQAVHRFLLPRLPALMKVYQHYASLDGDVNAPPPPPSKKAVAPKPSSKAALMDLSEFVLLLEHAGLLDDVTVMSKGGDTAAAAAAQLKSQKASLTAQEVRETFSGVQREDDGSGADDEDEELTFGEFLEAIGRAAIAKWGDAVGLKFVLDPRQNAMRGGAAAGAGTAEKISTELMNKSEKAFVRALVMWAFYAVSQVERRLGLPISAPVQYDTNELARLVTIGMTDVMAAATSAGVSAQSFQCLPDEGAESAAAKADRLGAGPGVLVFAAKHPLRPKTPFGTLRGPGTPIERRPLVGPAGIKG